MGRYLVYAELDYRIMTQDGRNAGIGCSTNRTLLWLTEMECAKIRTHCKADIRRPNMGGLAYSK